MTNPAIVLTSLVQKARKVQITRETPESLGVEVTPRLQTVKVEEPSKRKAGVKLNSVQELVDKLRNEAKVI